MSQLEKTTKSDLSRKPGSRLRWTASIIGCGIMLFSIMMVFVIGHFLDVFETRIEFNFRQLLFFANIVFGIFGLGLAFTSSIRWGFGFAGSMLLILGLAFDAGQLAGNYD